MRSVKQKPSRAPDAPRLSLEDGSLELEDVACDLCGARDTRERYRKPDTGRWTTDFEFPVVECLECGLVYVNPRPTPRCMSAFYSGGYHEGRDDAKHARRYARQLEHLPPLAGKSVLDVGCARGDFLAFVLARHPDVRAHGVDAYSDGVVDPRIAFDKVSLPERRFPDASFDVVTAWAVFEHLHEPSRYFADIARVLKPGGCFTFLVTNAESLWSKRAFGEDVPRHTYHYSERTLGGYAAKHGFHVRGIEFDDRIFDGRGKGTFRWKLMRAAGVGWKAYARRELSPLQHAARSAGKLADAVAFGLHWEARLRRSGMIVARFERPAAAPRG